MCSEGSCCGPSCSVRSWFVTHVVFVMLGAIGFMIQVIQVVIIIKSVENLLSSGHDYYTLDYGDLNVTRDFLIDHKNVLQNILDLVVVAFVFRIVWSIIGWVLVCLEKKVLHIVYVALCGVDFVLNLALIVLPVVQFGKLLPTDESGQNVSGLYATVMAEYVMTGLLGIAIMDVAPLFCLACCREKTLSKYSSGVARKGVVYSPPPQNNTPLLHTGAAPYPTQATSPPYTQATAGYQVHTDTPPYPTKN